MAILHWPSTERPRERLLAGAWAAALASACLVFALIGEVGTTDGPLLLSWALLMWLFWRAQQAPERLGRWLLWGAVLALLGLTLAPILILVALATLYDQFATNPDVIAGTKAAAAGAAGLIFGTGYKLGKTILDNRAALFFAALSLYRIQDRPDQFVNISISKHGSLRLLKC